MVRAPARKAPPTSGLKPLGKVICDPIQISEDEADGIVSRKRLKEPLISFEDHLRKRGHVLERKVH